MQAIARAVYARKRIACFDDVLSGLDNATARHVFNNVFGLTGLLRRLGCMVFLATHTGVSFRLPHSSFGRSKSPSHANYVPVHHLPQADLILVLGEDGRVARQGRFTDLREEIDDLAHIEGMQLRQNDVAEITDELPELLNQPAESIRAPSIDAKRPMTDLAVYKYYFSALGWLRISALLFFLITEAGMSGFRCKL